MIKDEKAISKATWEEIRSEHCLKLSWKSQVYESIKAMKRKYKKDCDKKYFEKALEISRKTCCYK